ncbi:hypothetical protein ACLE20_15135 [Rhizobium sp. YIM 134829]|uniref:hypothetical protein n=1 Tax=Rhizobium sp. YIM 134829 TaxID=3390453 RepID=UPI0039792C1B
MTVVFGECFAGKVFLAADTKRRDHQNGRLSIVDKLHRLSNDVIIAQGGAGTGAADVMVAKLKDIAHQASPDQIIAACQADGPVILREAAKTWRINDRQIPPTFIITASIGSDGNGRIVSINLSTGEPSQHRSSFVSGTHTAQAAEVLGGLRSHCAGFDALAVRSVVELERLASSDIGMPVDVGIIEETAEGRVSELYRLTENFFMNPSFRY